METKVSLEGLCPELSRIVEDAGAECIALSEKCVQDNAEQLNAEIPNETAFNDGVSKLHLRNSFKVSKDSDSSGVAVKYIVHATTKNHKYSIVHLVENGHVQKAYKPGARHFVEARHFLKPLSDKYSIKIASEIKSIIEGASGGSQRS